MILYSLYQLLSTQQETKEKGHTESGTRIFIYLDSYVIVCRRYNRNYNITVKLNTSLTAGRRYLCRHNNKQQPANRPLSHFLHISLSKSEHEAFIASNFPLSCIFSSCILSKQCFSKDNSTQCKGLPR